MAVSKRLRFEILRRDNHTCYYCGRRPPEVEITIDHVLPQALGGPDEASNLVAACRECNGGKTSIAPGSPLVEQVNEDAIRWSAALQAAIVKAEADHEAVITYREQFLEAWNDYKQPAELDENWRVSLDTFRSRGLPIEMLIDAAHRAMAKSNIGLNNKFRYMCGIAWAKVSEIEKHARSLFAAETSDDEDGEESGPTLIEEILPIIGQEAFEAALAEVHSWHEDCDGDSAEEDEHNAIISALYDMHSERHNLARAIEGLLNVLIPASECWSARQQAEERLRSQRGSKAQGWQPREFNPELWRVAADAVMDTRAEKYMKALGPEERDEWLRYAAALNSGNTWGWGDPTEEQLTRRAGRAALEVVAGWRPNAMCFTMGEHISRCPRRGTARIAVAGCVECGVEPLAAEVGLLICDEHLEAAIERGVPDRGGHRLSVTDFVVLTPELENEVPF